MMHRIGRMFIALVLAAVLLLPLPSVDACGPFFPEAIFVQVKHPDLPFDRFAAGQLGILQSSYAPSFLVVAYRYLSGGSFSGAEQQQLTALWAHHYQRENEWLGERKDAYQQWLEARYEFGTGSKPAPVQENNPGYGQAASQYNEYENCSQDAFRTAAKTLQARSKEFGQHSPEVQSWLDAQDTVFDNCGGPFSKTGKAEVPEEAPKQLAAIMRADRAYQIAAAYFYIRDWDEAERRFEVIARDSSSPWQSIAAIVALRTKLRRITLSDEPVESFHDELAAIDAELRKLEQLPSMHDLGPAIWRMRGFVEFRLDPDARRLELARVIEHGEDPATLREDVGDYALLLERPAHEESGGERVAVPPERAKALRSQSPMTDWIFTIQAADQASTDHAVAMWQQSHSLLWLLTALAKIAPGSADVHELLQAAETIAPTSPGYPTIAFHRARLLSQSGDAKTAIAIADGALALPSIESLPSTANLFRALRMKLARKLDEFLRFAPRTASVISFDMDNRDLPDPGGPGGPCEYSDEELRAACEGRLSMFDIDASRILTEKIPTRVLVEAASSSRLPANLRREVVQSAWVRAVMLNDEGAARRLTPFLASVSPELADGLKTYTAANGASRRFAAVFLILHRPELRPYISAGIGRQTPPGQMDSYHDNWWCTFAPTTGNVIQWVSYYARYSQADGPLLNIYANRELAAPAFVTESDTKLASTEWEALAKLGAAPDWLAAQVLAFAKSNPDDPRVPEALHFVVRATHLGCSDGETRHYSRAAFQTLHKGYPHEAWTAKTPYWY